MGRRQLNMYYIYALYFTILVQNLRKKIINVNNKLIYFKLIDYDPTLAKIIDVNQYIHTKNHSS